MSYYFKYNYVSPEADYAEVKDELKSYFDTGIVDDVLFPRYTTYIINKLGKGTHPVDMVVLFIEDFNAKLPEDLLSVREVYSCFTLKSLDIPNANSFYTQHTIINPVCYNKCNPGQCIPDEVTVVDKVNGGLIYQFKVAFLLKPGNINTIEKCSPDCRNLGSSCLDSFDIRDGRIYTNFRKGIVYVTYYKEAYDNNYYQMIPDFEEFHDCHRAYLKYKAFETVFNNVTDETFNQVAQKLQLYKQQFDEKLIIAKTELMKKTIYQSVEDSTRDMQRFQRMYVLR